MNSIATACARFKASSLAAVYYPFPLISKEDFDGIKVVDDFCSRLCVLFDLLFTLWSFVRKYVVIAQLFMLTRVHVHGRNASLHQRDSFLFMRQELV